MDRFWMLLPQSTSPAVIAGYNGTRKRAIDIGLFVMDRASRCYGELQRFSVDYHNQKPAIPRLGRCEPHILVEPRLRWKGQLLAPRYAICCRQLQTVSLLLCSRIGDWPPFFYLHLFGICYTKHVFSLCDSLASGDPRFIHSPLRTRISYPAKHQA